jgi:large subunit ribosomal protein L25
MIIVDVPVHVTGTATGVKDFGGILEFVSRSVPVECLPTDIPDAITIDITKLGIHDSIHVRDIEISNARIDLSPDHVIVTVVPPTVEKAAGTPEEGAVAAAEPEVIGKKKEEGGEAAAGDKGEKKDDKKKDKK